MRRCTCAQSEHDRPAVVLRQQQPCTVASTAVICCWHMEMTHRASFVSTYTRKIQSARGACNRCKLHMCQMPFGDESFRVFSMLAGWMQFNTASLRGTGGTARTDKRKSTVDKILHAKVYLTYSIHELPSALSWCCSKPAKLKVMPSDWWCTSHSAVLSRATIGCVTSLAKWIPASFTVSKPPVPL